MTAREQYVAFMTIVRKEINRYLRIWTQTLLPSAITMSLYFVIFGSLIGSRIGEMGGFSYMQFVVPGLIMMAIVTNSYSNVVSSFFGSKFNHSVEELLVSPTPNYVILLGYVMGGVTRGLLVAVVVTLVSLFFTHLHIHSYLVVVVIVLMTSTLFALAGFINAVYANNFDGTDPESYLAQRTCEKAPSPETQWQGENINRFCDPAYDELVAELGRTGELSKRGEIAKKLNDMLTKESFSMLPLVDRGRVSAASNTLGGVVLNTWDSELWNVADWYRMK